MWIVKLALRRPYTFIVLAIVITLFGVFAIWRTPTDIFPNIRIPVVATVWKYTGLSPEEMATRLILNGERTAQTTVNDVEHTESQSVSGTSVVKYFFQPNVKEELSYAQITGVSQTMIRFAPPGTTPPFVLAYNASSVPILQLALSSASLSEAQLFDQGNSVIRTELSTVAGASMPWPYGGLQRQVQVDLDPDALRAHGLSGNDVTAAIAAQNSILPAGTEKIGDREYFVAVNANPKTVAELNEMPVATRNGRLIYVRDVAHVRDGYPPQTNIVRRDGHRGVLMSVLKTGSASTLDIIRSIKDRLPGIRDALPPDFKIDLVGDQSIFVRAAISGVVREAVIAASLTALMILLFLGTWRSTLIIAISIPLSILASIICLSALGETINIMTLGGLALAVGILVDDATVTIENINMHLERGEDVEAAILNGAHEIAVPAFVSTLAICIVFVPMFMLVGIARYLFVPLAEAVVFAMLASYLLSRTLVPTLAKYWLQRHEAHAPLSAFDPLRRLQLLQRRFEQWFRQLREAYHGLLERAVRSGPRFAMPFLGAMAATALLAFPLGRFLPGLGQDFFPSVDAGQIKLHLRGPTGVRIDETATLRDRDHRRQHRHSLQRHQPGLFDIGAGGPRGRRYLCESHRGPPADGPLRASAARAAHGALRLHDFRLPASGYRQPDPQFRPPGPDRRAGGRLQRGGQPRLRAGAARSLAPDPRDRGSAHPAGLRLPHVECRGRPQQGGAPRALRDGCCVRPAGLALRELTDHPLLLDRPEERYPVRHRRPDAAVPARFPRGPRHDAGHRRRQRWGSRRAAARQPCELSPQRRPCRGEPLRLHAGGRHLRSRRRRGPRLRCRAGEPRARRHAALAPARLEGRGAGSGEDHDGVLRGAAARAGSGDRARVPADRGQLPVLARPVHHHHRSARGARRDRVDAVPVAHAGKRPGADRCDHVHGGGDRQQRARGELRARAHER